MTAAVLATAAFASLLLPFYIRARRARARRERQRQARADEWVTLVRADRDRVIRERDSLAVQTWSLRRRVDVEAAARRRAEFLAETYLAAWRRETRERRALTDQLAALDTPAPVVVDELRQRRDARGRFVPAAQRAAGEVEAGG